MLIVVHLACLPHLIRKPASTSRFALDVKQMLASLALLVISTVGLPHLIRKDDRSVRIVMNVAIKSLSVRNVGRQASNTANQGVKIATGWITQ